MTGTIDAQEFIKHLYKSGLVIVDKKEYIEKSEISIAQKRKSVLRNPKCTIKELIDCKWFDASTNTVKSWFMDHDYIMEHQYSFDGKAYQIRTSVIPDLLKNDKIKKL